MVSSNDLGRCPLKAPSCLEGPMGEEGGVKEGIETYVWELGVDGVEEMADVGGKA